MVKVKNPKRLIHANPEKGKAAINSVKKTGKQTGVVNTQSVKTKKEKLLQSSLKESNKLPLNAKSASLKQAKKDKISEITVPTAGKRLVLAPAESPTPKKPIKSKKLLAKSSDNDAKVKSEPHASDENIAPVGKSRAQAKKQPDKKQTDKEKVKPKESALDANEKAPKKHIKKVHETVAVDEETFDSIVTATSVTKIVETLKTLVENEVATKKLSIFGDYNYCLNVSGFKIASCPKRIYKLNLKHSLVDSATDDILIVVSDLKRGAKVEFESTVEHYTDLFQEAGIKGLKIMPFNQLRNEYKSFESKRKLAATYDYYLCDGRLVGQVAGFCGSIFQKPRTTFHTVRLENPKALKAEIDKALRRTSYKQLSKGDLITITVGSDKLTAEQTAENVLEVVSQLKNTYPGGFDNIRGIDIKVNIKGTPSLPIYACTAAGPDEVPYVVGPREQRMLKLKKQTNEVLSKFTLTKDAELIRLNKTQVERKRQFREARSVLIADQSKTSEDNKEDGADKEDGEDNAVPAKKSKVAPKVAEKKPKSKANAKKQKKP